MHKAYRDYSGISYGKFLKAESYRRRRDGDKNSISAREDAPKCNKGRMICRYCVLC